MTDFEKFVRGSNLAAAINQKLDSNHLKHVQCLLRRYQNEFVLKFVSCDIPGYKEKVKKICDEFWSLTLIAESKTTLTYSF